MNKVGNWSIARLKNGVEGVTPPVPIAIVGMGCRMPGGVTDYAGLWQFLLDRKTAIREIPEDRWNLKAFHDSDPNAVGRGRSRWAGFCENIFDFDPGFFDISPREVLAMDPQQRMLLQVAYEAAQDGGVTLADLAAARTGVFVGISSMEFASTQRVQSGSGDIFGGTGSALSIAAGRISHRLNLTGPSFVVDTACSSALVALDQACRNLADGWCDIALAGGVNCLLDPTAFVAFAKANMLSPGGGCFAFDKRADGFIRGEGAGLLLLKRLDQAKRDGDRIHAVILATGVNQDGRTSTLTSPNGEAQEALMREVVALAGLEPRHIGYVEAHGTGTPTGDPIEANAIGRVFARDRDGGPLPMCSIKPNIGHLESAAGVAGMLKAVMTLKERTIAPHQNFQEANPAIPLDALNMTIPVTALDFPSNGDPRRVVVNSFGFGGTSACAVVEEAEAPAPAVERPIVVRSEPAMKGPVLVPISAPNQEGLAAWAGRLSEAVRETKADPAAVAHALSKRDHFASRAVVLSDGDSARLADSLARIAAGEQPAEGGNEIVEGKAPVGRRLVFTFSGQGAQWWAMGRQLLQEEPVYREAVAAFDRHFEPLAGWRAMDAMLASEKESVINRNEVTQATLIAMQVALAALWRERGVTPDFVLGHSLGEIAAAHVAGAISLETTARIIHKRGLIGEQSPETGAMAVVGLSEEAASAFMTEGEDVVIGAINGPAMVSLTGRSEPLDRVLAAIKAAEPDAFLRKLNTGFAWHSRLLDYGEKWFRKELGEVEWSTPSIPLISTVEPGLQTRFDLDYWWLNLRRPVRYRDGILIALDLGLDAFLEIGPHRTVTPLTVSVANERGASALAAPSLERGGDDHKVMAKTAARLHAGGLKLDWSRYAPARGARFETPLYPWRNQTLRQYSVEADYFLNEPFAHPLLGRREFGPAPRWMSEIDTKGFAYFRDHRILGGAVLPAAGYVEMMIAALRAQHGPGTVELRQLEFPEALSLDGDISVLLRTDYDPVSGRLHVYSRERGTEDWRMRAEGYGLWRPIATPTDAPPRLPDGVKPTIDGDGFYALAAKHGYEYGRTFRGIESIWLTGDNTQIAAVVEPSGLDAAALGYTLHPATFDSALQTAIALYDRNHHLWDPEAGENQPQVDPNAFVMRIPVQFDKILVYDTIPTRSLVEFTGDADGEAGIYRIYGEDGRPAAIVERLHTKALKSNRRADGGEATPAAYYVDHFLPVPAAERPADTAANPGRWLIVAGSESAAAPLAAALAAKGAAVEQMTAASVESGALSARLGEAEAGGDRSLAGIVFAPLLGLAPDGPAEPTTSAAMDLVALAERAVKMDVAAAPRIVLLTESARTLPGDPHAGAASIAARGLLAMLRTVANERPTLRLQSIDLDPVALGDAAELVAEGMIAGGSEPERVLRGRTWYAPRLDVVPPEQQPPQRFKLDTATSSDNYIVTLTEPGSLDNIVLREAPMPKPGKGELIVEIGAIGLNFRDVMAATGILPGEVEGERAWWRNLGFEFAGIIRSVGKGVRGWKVGDRVMAPGFGFMRRFARVLDDVIVRVPDNVSTVEAATIPITFLTAEYCLVELGRLRRGESVLIHLGTGGVGLAAIQVAKAIGAKIFATAGNDEKRSYLRNLGIEHVMDSRSLDFAEQVRAATGGRGVDVVLNSLSGPAIEKSLECLAPLGRFVEIGKRDIAADHPIGLRALYHNNSYAVFDLSEILALGHERLQRPFRTIAKNMEKGIYKPLPVTLFPASKAADAMRHLAKAVHIGKVAIRFDEKELQIERDLSRPASFRADGTYLVTGGLRGFGLTVAEWMAARGAGRLVLASRSGAPDKGDVKRVARLGKKAELRCVALDVANAAAVDALVKELANSDKPLVGIVHSAAVIEDGLLDQLDRKLMDRVVSPKLGGAWNLHSSALAAGAKLDHFISFSSVAAAIGSVGQANYVAANAGLERLSEHRRSMGLPGIAIGWGPLAESGFVARSDALKSYLESTGMRPLTDEESFAALDRLVRVDQAATVFAAVDWASLGRALPTGSSPRLAPLSADRARGGNRLATRLAAAPAGDHEKIVAEAIREELAKVLRIEPAAIAFDRKVTELGLDSLSSFELKNRVEALCDLTIPVAKFLGAPTVGGLAVVVTALMAAKRAETAAQDDASGTSASKGSQGALPTLARQSLYLGLAGAPAANAATRAALEWRHVASLAASVDPDRLEAAISDLAASHEAVRLTAALREGEGWQLAFGSAPKLARLAEGEELPGLPGEGGALWAFGLREHAGNKELVIRAHRAAADLPSVVAAASELIARLSGATPDAGASWADYARSLSSSEETDAYRRNYSFWTEMLGRAGDPLIAAERVRARMPSRLGVTRGAILAASGSLDLGAFDAKSAAEREAIALAAFARTVGLDFGSDAVIVERHDPARRDATAGAPLGPVADSVPLVLTGTLGRGPQLLGRVRRALDNARAHRAFDRAMVERVFEAKLTSRPVSLGEFGFSLVETDDLDATAEMLAAEPWNSLRLNLIASPNGSSVQFVYDDEVLTKADIDRLGRSFAAELAALIGSDETVASTLEARAPRPAAAPAATTSARSAAAMASPLVLAKRGGLLPVSMQQNFLLSSLADPRTTDVFRRFWQVSRAYWIRPRVDLARLRDIVTGIMARHEALRSRFVAEQGAFRVRIDRDPVNPLVIEDLGDVGETAALARLRALSEKPLEPLSDPLYAVTLLRCGKDGDLLFCRGHQTILDGWSMSSLVEELMAGFFGLPTPSVELTFAEYLNEFDRSHDPAVLKRREAYFRALLANPPARANFGRITKGRTPNLDMVDAGPGGEIIAPLPAMGRAAITEAVRRTGTSETALLLGAFAQTIAPHTDSGEVVILVPAAMRTDRRLRNFVGWVSTMVPVRADTKAHPTLDGLAQSLYGQIRESLSYLPADFTVRHGPLHDELNAAGSYVTMFEAGMQTVESLYRGSATAAFHRPGGGEEISFGPVRIKKVGDDSVRSDSIFELDLRSFDSAAGPAIRCGYDTLGSTRAEVEAVLGEVLDRLGAGADSSEEQARSTAAE